jgi:hypothetical protein
VRVIARLQLYKTLVERGFYGSAEKICFLGLYINELV